MPIKTDLPQKLGNEQITRRGFGRIACAAVAWSAVDAMRGGGFGLSGNDPYAFPDLGASGGTGYYYTNGLTPRWRPIDPAKKTAVYMSIAQSQRCDYAGNIFIPTNTANIDHLNINDGALYPITGPMLGCSINTNVGSAGGNVLAYVADILATHYDYVIMVPLGITNTSIEEWSTSLYLRARAAMRRLAARGITPSTPGVEFITEIAQGETNVSAGTSTVAWQGSCNALISNLRNDCGIPGNIYVPKETLITVSSVTTTSAIIRAGQAGVCDNLTVFAGADGDTIGIGGRPQDGTHFTTGTVPPLATLSTGPNDLAILIGNAMHAAGQF